MATSAPLSEKAPEETDNPAQELADREFNPDKQTAAAGNPTDPRGNDVAAGDPSDPRGQPGPDELREQEQLPDANGPDESFYRPGRGQPAGGRFSLRGRLTKKRGLLGGGILAVIVSSIISFFLISGPAEMVQLSRILQHPFSKNDSDTHNRLGKLYRFAKTGDIGETRVSRLGSKFFGNTIDQLKEKGVSIERNALGRPTKTTIDTEKLKEDFPELKGASTAERKAFLADKLGLDVGQIQGDGTIFTVDQTEMNVKSANLLTKSTVGLLDRNGLVSAIKSRELAKFFDLPSLFHPLSRAIADKENQIVNAAQRKQQQQQDEQQREAALTEPVEAEGAGAVTDIKEESNKYNSTAMKALLFTGGVCFVRSITGDIVAVNHDLVVLPAAIRATDLIAVGAQAEAGQDMDLGQLGQIEKGLTDPATGKTVWQGQALKALETGGKADQSLTDITPDYRQAFSGDTTAANIKEFVDKALTISLPFGVKVDAATYACSPEGILLQIGGGLFLSVSSLIGEVGSGGTLTPAVVGLWAAKEGVSFAISAVAMHFVSGFILNSNTAKLALGAFSGPVGGDLLAYGARAAANTAAIASGGLALGNQASTLLAVQERQQEQQQFNSESIVQRLFNPYDYRTPVGKLIQTGAGSPINDLARMGSLFTGFGSLFKHSFSTIVPKAAAASTPYDWGFPQYGLPDSVLNDPNLDDPYSNAQYVAINLLDKNATDGNGMSYPDKALACFGVNITPLTDSDGKTWDVIPANEVNPSDSKYLSANCNDTDENWKRVEMFVFDTSTMKASACYQGDEQSCTDLGANSSGASSTQSGGGSSGGGSLPSGTAQQLAQQLVPFVNNGKIKCVGLGGNIGCSDITNTANNVSIQGGLGCQVDSLQPGLLGMLLKLVQMGHTFSLSALCSDHHDDGLAGHAGGRAADFNTIDGVFMGPDATSPWTSDKLQAGEKLDQDIASFMPASTGFGQKQCHPEFPFLNGFSLFDDTCNHQHVQVEI